MTTVAVALRDARARLEAAGIDEAAREARLLLAHAIHAASMRGGRPFVGINVAAIPDALLEAEFFGVAPGAYTGAEKKGREGKFQLADGAAISKWPTRG